MIELLVGAGVMLVGIVFGYGMGAANRGDRN